MQVISDIQKGNGGRYGAIVTEIKARSSSFSCIFMFEGRAANQDADRLAKFAYSLDQGRHVWMLIPHDPFCIPQTVVFDE